MSIDSNLRERAERWLNPVYDEATRREVQEMLDNDPKALTDAFYKDLDFGTGGLRGIMGAGTNRVNKYTFGMATQGLANYLKLKVSGQIKVVISHDSRHNSRLFAEQTADILSANGIHAFLFEDLRPTPLLSYAIRKLDCHSGIMITASHNPPEYNGYKVYWSDGGQLVPPHDKNVIEEVRKVQVDQVKFDARADLISQVGEEVEESYYNDLKGLSLSQDGKKDLKVVFTSIHGTAITMMPRALKTLGFEQVFSVEEQDKPDGNFPTVESPNPEESAALKMAVDKAESIGADLVIGCDPDADRVGIAVRDEKNQMVLLNGNQTASVLIYYLLEQWKSLGKLNGKQFIAETVVTTDLLQEMAKEYGVECPLCLTGFKWIAELIREREGKLQFIGGGEESYGYLVGDFVRDKDAIGSAALIAEVAAWAKAKGSSFYQELLQIYLKFGLYQESLKSITKKGKEGADAIENMMKRMRSTPPSLLGGSEVVRVKDFQSAKEKDLRTGNESELPFPSSNVLQFFTADGYKVTARPSGTEPKIKFYTGLKSPVSSLDDIKVQSERLGIINDQILKDLLGE